MLIMVLSLQDVYYALILQLIWAKFGDKHIYLGECFRNCHMFVRIGSVRTLDWQHAGMVTLPIALTWIVWEIIMNLLSWKTSLQSMTVRIEEWRLKRRDTEEWMRHRQLPEDLQERVRRFVQYKWLATRGVDEEFILQSLPLDLRREIQRHLCLSLVRRVRHLSVFLVQISASTGKIIYSLFIWLGSFLRTNGWPTFGRDVRASSLVVEYRRQLHRPRRRTGQRDALHHPRPTRELHDWWRKNRLLQLHHPPVGWFLWRRASHMGSNAQLHSQPPPLNSNRPSSFRSWSLRTPSRWPPVLRTSIQKASKQEAPARIPILFSSMADVGCMFHTSCLEKV